MTPDDAQDLREEISKIRSKLTEFLEKERVGMKLGVMAMLIVAADAIKDVAPHKKEIFAEMFLKLLDCE